MNNSITQGVNNETQVQDDRWVNADGLWLPRGFSFKVKTADPKKIIGFKPYIKEEDNETHTVNQ